MESEPMSQTKKVKLPLPWWRRILLFLVGAVMVMLIGFILINFMIGKQLAGEIARISQAGEPLSFAELSDRLNSTSGD